MARFGEYRAERLVLAFDRLTGASMALAPFERIRLDKAAVDEGLGIRRADEGDWLATRAWARPRRPA